MIGEDHGAVVLFMRLHLLLELFHLTAQVKDVISEDERHRIFPDKVSANQKGLRDTLGFGLNGILKGDAETLAIAQQSLDVGRVLWRGDHQILLDAKEHQQGERIVDHRLVIDG